MIAATFAEDKEAGAKAFKESGAPKHAKSVNSTLQTIQITDIISYYRMLIVMCLVYALIGVCAVASKQFC